MKIFSIKSHKSIQHVRMVLIFLLFILMLFVVPRWESIFNSAQQRYYIVKNQFSKHPAMSQIETFTVTSSALHDEEKEIRVYVPSQYVVNKKGRFPVLYMLHGAPGNNQDWLINTNMQNVLDDLILKKEIPPMLVVFPDGQGPTIADSQYVNATTIDQNMETYITDDVVKVIDAQYRTIADRRARAIGGSSSGAYAAINVGLRHNDKFGVLMSFSGYFVNREWIVRQLFGKDTAALRDNSPLRYISSLRLIPQTYVYIFIGSNDYASFVKDNHDMDIKLTSLNIPHTLSVGDGSHGWDLWRDALPDALQYLGHHISIK